MSATIKIAAGDIFRNGRGSAEYVDGINKHAQDLAYHQMTPFDPDRNIGNELVDMDNPILTGKNAAQGMIGNLVRDCVARFEDHQENIAEIVTDDERLLRIRTLDVRIYNQTPQAYLYYLVTEVVSGDVVESAKVVEDRKSVV